MATNPEEQAAVQPFPKMMYKAKDRKDDKAAAATVEYDNTTVQDEKEMKEHLAKGWKTEPPEAPEAKEPKVPEPKVPEHSAPIRK